MAFRRNTKEEAKEIITELAESFRNNIQAYKDKNYKEQRVRQEYIDLFFKALNWDVNNEEKRPDKYKFVVIEDTLEINGQKKEPDYSFRYFGDIKFYVEAKKPSVDIKNDIDPAYQVRTYAYTRKLLVSILTDFEEFSVYDTKTKPTNSDKASVCRIKYLTYDEYADNFDYIWDHFSFDAIENCNFEKAFETGRNKQGTGDIDSDLLKTIENWRLELAKNIALRNPQINLRTLNTAVQKIIDRIIFLRIAEDKDFENYEDIKKCAESENVLSALKTLFDRANEKYNSGLFDNKDFPSDINIDEKVLKKIISELYYPLCPYQWKVLPVEILGNIYEKFLGSEIVFRNVKGGHTAQVEEKPEIKKAGGVYYTPQYIVKYIVENTLGERLKTFKPGDSLTVCDPACGSGSFLIGAYKYLLNWHLEYYEKDRKKYLKKGILAETAKGINLSVDEKKRILTSHIFGVDIDAQAVEVTKLSLFLQMLEEEGKGLNDLFRGSDLTVLPSLYDNIQSGNSLIGSDFYNDKLDLWEDEELRYKINTFDWEKRFKPIFDAGGFDIVIGNPPYIQFQKMDEPMRTIYSERDYEVFIKTGDIYSIFYEKGMKIAKDNGLVGFITSNKWMSTPYGEKLRKFFVKYNPYILADLGPGVFKGATVDTDILILEKAPFAHNTKACNIKTEEARENMTEYFDKNSVVLKELSGDSWFIADEKETALKKNIEEKGLPLGKWDVSINRGILTGFNDAFIISTETKNEILNNCGTDEERERTEKIIRPILRGRDIKRYSYTWTDEWIINTHNGLKKENLPAIKINDYPAIKKHLDKYKSEITDRYDKGDTPYNLRNCKYLRDFDKEKIMWAGVGLRIDLALIEKGIIVNNPASFLISKDNTKYLIGVLNSQVINFYKNYICTKLGSNGYRIYNEDILKLPIPPITEENKSIVNEIENLTDKITEAKRKLEEMKKNNALERDIETQEQFIDIIDNNINRKVYELYGLSKDEIAIIEKQN